MLESRKEDSLVKASQELGALFYLRMLGDSRRKS